MKSIFWIAVFVFLVWLVVRSHNDSPIKSDQSSYESQDAVNGSEEHSTFAEDPCTYDCSGHEAGYDWAERNSIDDEDDCDKAADDSNSPSFGEGCKAYVNGDSPEEDEDSENN